MPDTPTLIDRAALAAHRRRATKLDPSDLHDIAVTEIEERLAEINKSFTKPALVGNVPPILRALFPDAPVVEDAERLALEPGTHDLVVHAFGLHWADDPVGQLVQSRLALEPDGLFLGVLFAGQTLTELRAVLAEAETRATGGLSPRVVPMADVRALGDLLVRAGFALPVADTLVVDRSFPSVAELVMELRALGETNALMARHRRTVARRFWPAVEAIYREHFPATGGTLAATFEMVFLTGWAPHESQQKPLRPGAATTRLADALGVPERPTGDRATPKTR